MPYSKNGGKERSLPPQYQEQIEITLDHVLPQRNQGLFLLDLDI